MLKDAFNRKPNKKEPGPSSSPNTGMSGMQQANNHPAEQGADTDIFTVESPTQAYASGSESDSDDSAPVEGTGPNGILSTQQLAAMTLQRLIETYQPPSPQDMAPPEPVGPPPQTSAMEFTPEPVQASECDLSGHVFHGLYQVEGLLAKGGMGQVLYCTHLARNIPVVMKLMLREASSGDTAFQRFLQECKVTHKLRHPNLVKVLDYGIMQEGFKPYLVMELVEGASLRQILRRRFALVPSDIAQVLIQACEGLNEVHTKGIIHRDLKPENLMVRGIPSSPDNVKILDFGIAQLQKDKRFDEEGWAIGSIGYMSPEQVCGQEVDLRTDIYSLGLIFYEAITGKPPFRGRTPKETMAMHVKAPLTLPSQIVHCENAQLVDRICSIALAKHPTDRYATTKDMQRDLASLVK